MTIKMQSFDPTVELPPEFLDLPDRVYRGDSRFQRPFPDSVRSSLMRPDFDGRQRAFVARSKGRAAARIVARVSPTLVAPSGRPYGLLGFFEALEDRPTVRGLFDAAAEWLAARQVTEVIGPMDGDTWHRYRLNVGPFEEPPFLMEPYNPAYYPELWRSNGFEVLETYLSQRVSDLPAVVESMSGKARRAVEAGYRIEPLEMGDFDAALERLYRLSIQVFSGNFLYTEISKESFLDLYRSSRPLVDPELVLFATAPSGEDAGFLFAFPDRFRAVAAMRGKRHLLARLRYLALSHSADTINLKSLGVVPEHRKSGLGAALMHRAYETGMRRGYRAANLCLLREGNPSGRLEGGSSRLLRRYELYERRL